MRPKLCWTSHLHGDVIIKNAFNAEYTELTQVLESIDIPLRSAGPFTMIGRPPTPKRQMKPIGGQKRYLLMPIDQKTLNERIADELKKRGWSAQPLADAASQAGAAKLKGDFVKNRVFVEVEFGNSASLHRDLFKFQIANRGRSCDVAVVVVPKMKVARFMDQNVATYEYACSLRYYLSIGIQMPIWIVGLDLENWVDVRARYNEMFTLAKENGVDCHDFDTALGTDESLQTGDAETVE